MICLGVSCLLNLGSGIMGFVILPLLKERREANLRKAIIILFSESLCEHVLRFLIKKKSGRNLIPS